MPNRDSAITILRHVVLTVSTITAISIIGYHLLEPQVVAPSDAEAATVAVRDFLKDLPTRQSLYFAFTAAIVAWLAWRACLRNRLQTELNQQRQQHVTEDTLLTDRDWTVVATLRHRAFQLRGRAAAILVGIFLLLFCGIYLVLFILPKVLQDDRTAFAQAHFFREFGDTLDHLTRGHHWVLSTAGDHKPPSKPPDRPIKEFREVSMYTLGLRSRGVSLRRTSTPCPLEEKTSVSAVRFDDTMTSGFCINRDGDAYNSTDGGANWIASGSVEAPEGESFAFASLSRNGKNALVATRSGHVVYRANPTSSWRRAPNFGQITRRAFSHDGTVAAFASKTGNVSLLLLTSGEKVDLLPSAITLPVRRVTISANGHTVAFIDDAGVAFSATKKADWKVVSISDRTTKTQTVVVSGDGATVAMLGSDGSVTRRQDASNTPYKPTQLGLAKGEDPRRIWLGPHGKTIIIAGDEGTLVTIHEDDHRRTHSQRLDLARFEDIDRVVFAADGSTTIASGDDGSIFRRLPGEPWTKLTDLPFDPTEQLLRISRLPDNRGFGLQTRRRQVHIKDATEGWVRLSEVKWKRGESFAAVGVQVTGRDRPSSKQSEPPDADAGLAVVVGSKGSVFTGDRRGKQWRRLLDLELSGGERPKLVRISADGGRTVVVTNRGRAYLSDDGKRWIATRGLPVSDKQGRTSDTDSMKLWWTTDGFAMTGLTPQTSDNEARMLRPYAKLKPWASWSPGRMLRK